MCGVRPVFCGMHRFCQLFDCGSHRFARFFCRWRLACRTFGNYVRCYLSMTKWRNEMKMLKRFLVPLFAAASLAPLPSVAADACPLLLNYSFRAWRTKPSRSANTAARSQLVVNTASYWFYQAIRRPRSSMRGSRTAASSWSVSRPMISASRSPAATRRSPISVAHLRCPVPDVRQDHRQGANANPFFAELVKRSDTTPKWNFHKYLIDRSGREVVAYSSFSDPDDRKCWRRSKNSLPANPESSLTNPPAPNPVGEKKKS